MSDRKLYLIVLLGILLLTNCKGLKQDRPNIVKNDVEINILKYYNLWRCFNEMLGIDSLQPYYKLCLHAFDTCKPTLFVDEGSLTKIFYAKEWDEYKVEESVYLQYKKNMSISVERIYSGQGIDLWADYILYFTNIEEGQDSFYVGFDMKVESNYKYGPTSTGLHAYRPRRNYPQIHADVYFHRVDTSWEVSNYVIHPLPPHQPRGYLNDGVGGFRKEPPRFDCYANPAEEIPFPGQVDSVWRLPPLPPLRGSRIKNR